MREAHVVRYINNDDCWTVLSRVPAEYKTRLRDVFTWYDSKAVRCLGWVRSRGRRDLNIAGWLPPRVSLLRYVWKHPGLTAEELGAPARGQWPPWAVRRYLLYNTLLHELGHIQVADPTARRNNRRYASETRAQEFANEIRGRLYAQPFDHVDVVHNPPGDDELSFIRVWERLDKRQRYWLVKLALRAPHSKPALLGDLEPMTPRQRRFIERAIYGRPDG